MSPVFPPPAESRAKTSAGVSLPKTMWEELDRLVRHESAKPMHRRAGKTYSRNEAIAYLLEYAIRSYWAEEDASGSSRLEPDDGRPPAEGPERRRRKAKP